MKELRFFIWAILMPLAAWHLSGPVLDWLFSIGPLVGVVGGVLMCVGFFIGAYKATLFGIQKGWLGL